MSSEEPKLNDSEAENKPTSGESETAPQTSDVVYSTSVCGTSSRD